MNPASFSASRYSRVDRIGVGLGGHLGAGHEAPGVHDAVEHVGQVAHRQQGRGAAAEEHGGHRPRRDRRALEHGAGLTEFEDRLAGVVAAFHPAQLRGGVGVEVAVAAAGLAERDVHVHAEVAVLRAGGDRVRQQAVIRCRIGDRQSASHRRYFFSFFSVSPVSAATNASCGTSTRPTIFIRFLPSFCFSSSLRLRVMSPP